MKKPPMDTTRYPDSSTPVKRDGGDYGALIDRLVVLGAILCPTCGDYAIHRGPCDGLLSATCGGRVL